MIFNIFCPWDEEHCNWNLVDNLALKRWNPYPTVLNFSIVNPLKTGPFPIKTGVIWVPGIYIWLHIPQTTQRVAAGRRRGIWWYSLGGLSKPFTLPETNIAYENPIFSGKYVGFPMAMLVYQSVTFGKYTYAVLPCGTFIIQRWNQCLGVTFSWRFLNPNSRMKKYIRNLEAANLYFGR